MILFITSCLCFGIACNIVANKATKQEELARLAHTREIQRLTRVFEKHEQKLNKTLKNI